MFRKSIIIMWILLILFENVYGQETPKKVYPLPHKIGTMHALLIGTDISVSGVGLEVVSEISKNLLKISHKLLKDYQYDTYGFIDTVLGNKASMANILSILEWYKENLVVHDTLFIYYAGPGFGDVLEEFCLLPADFASDVENIARGRTLTELIKVSKKKILLKLILKLILECKAGKVFLVLDVSNLVELKENLVNEITGQNSNPIHILQLKGGKKKDNESAFLSGCFLKILQVNPKDNISSIEIASQLAHCLEKDNVELKSIIANQNRHRQDFVFKKRLSGKETKLKNRYKRITDRLSKINNLRVNSFTNEIGDRKVVLKECRKLVDEFDSMKNSLFLNYIIEKARTIAERIAPEIEEINYIGQRYCEFEQLKNRRDVKRKIKLLTAKKLLSLLEKYQSEYLFLQTKTLDVSDYLTRNLDEDYKNLRSIVENDKYLCLKKRKACKKFVKYYADTKLGEEKIGYAVKKLKQFKCNYIMLSTGGSSMDNSDIFIDTLGEPKLEIGHDLKIGTFLKNPFFVSPFVSYIFKLSDAPHGKYIQIGERSIDITAGRINSYRIGFKLRGKIMKPSRLKLKGISTVFISLFYNRIFFSVQEMKDSYFNTNISFKETNKKKSFGFFDIGFGFSFERKYKFGIEFEMSFFFHKSEYQYDVFISPNRTEKFILPIKYDSSIYAGGKIYF